MEKVYLYLARRTKHDTKIIGVLKSGSPIRPTRINELDLLGLSASKLQSLKNILESHRFDWDLWLESAENYKALQDSLLTRGIIAASSPNVPFMELESDEIPKTTLIKLNRNKVMTRRMS